MSAYNDNETCPWCGNFRVAPVDAAHPGLWRRQILCSDCGSRGPTAMDDLEAWAKWYARPFEVRDDPAVVGTHVFRTGGLFHEGTCDVMCRQCGEVGFAQIEDAGRIRWVRLYQDGLMGDVLTKDNPRAACKGRPSG